MISIFILIILCACCASLISSSMSGSGYYKLKMRNKGPIHRVQATQSKICPEGYIKMFHYRDGRSGKNSCFRCPPGFKVRKNDPYNNICQAVCPEDRVLRIDNRIFCDIRDKKCPPGFIVSRTSKNEDPPNMLHCHEQHGQRVEIIDPK